MDIQTRVEVTEDNLLHGWLGLLTLAVIEFAKLASELVPFVSSIFLRLPISEKHIWRQRTCGSAQGEGKEYVLPTNLLLQLLVRNIANDILHALFSVKEALLAAVDHAFEDWAESAESTSDGWMKRVTQLAFFGRFSLLCGGASSHGEVLTNRHALLIGQPASAGIRDPTMDTATSRVDPKHIFKTKIVWTRKKRS